MEGRAAVPGSWGQLELCATT